MLNFYSGYSKAVNPKKAIKESLNMVSTLTNEDISLVILHTTSGHNPEQLINALHEQLPNVQVVGCTGSGVVSNSFVNETVRSIALMAVTGSEYVTGMIEGVTQTNCFELSKSVAQELKNKKDSINMLMAFGPGLFVNGENIIAGITDVFSDSVPILGGLAGFNGTEPKTPILYNQGVFEQSIAVIGFFDPTLSVVQASHHGYLPESNQKFKVTKTTGPFVDEIDNKPAWPTLMKSFDLPSSTQPSEVISLLALGTDLSDSEQIAYDNKHKLRAPLILSEDSNSMMFQSTIEEGMVLTSCQRDEDYLMNGVDDLNSRLKNQYNGKKPIAIFQTDCMARGRMSNGVIEKEEIINNLQNGITQEKTAWLGLYAFGEFAQLEGKNHYHNYTASISVLLR